MSDQTINQIISILLVLITCFVIYFIHVSPISKQSEMSEQENFISHNGNTNSNGRALDSDQREEGRSADFDGGPLHKKKFNYVDPYYDQVYGIYYNPYVYSHWYPSPFWSDPLDYSTIEIDTDAETQKKRDTCKQQCFHKYADVSDSGEYIKSVGDCVRNCKRL